jgi:hypothetical protein
MSSYRSATLNAPSLFMRRRWRLSWRPLRRWLACQGLAPIGRHIGGLWIPDSPAGFLESWRGLGVQRIGQAAVVWSRGLFWVDNGRSVAHIREMVETFRTRLLEVSVTSEPPRWCWEVCAGAEMICSGAAESQIEARFEAYNAMFLLLAAGWAP